MSERLERAQCLVIRENKLLMVKLRLKENGQEFWCIPGGHIENGETPEEAAIRELKEECRVDGVILGTLNINENPSEEIILPYHKVYSFLMDIGNQEPGIGIEPESDEGILDVRWLSLDEIPERDRVDLWMAGLVTMQEFMDEVLSWGNDISYPGQGKYSE
ncbi:MAG: NUDIX hydrolase [Dehalococcoidales bacterium]|nr:MAG: NUDIX hydrolase [Dehalococcoidales bacterium]